MKNYNGTGKLIVYFHVSDIGSEVDHDGNCSEFACEGEIEEKGRKGGRKEDGGRNGRIRKKCRTNGAVLDDVEELRTKV